MQSDVTHLYHLPEAFERANPPDGGTADAPGERVPEPLKEGDPCFLDISDHWTLCHLVLMVVELLHARTHQATVCRVVPISQYEP